MTNFAAQINEFHCIVHLLLIFSTKQRGPLQATDDKHSMKSGLPYTSKSGLRYKSNFGKTILKNDDTENECFRVYKTPEDSYKDHSEFLKRKRYAALFQLDKNDYKSWAKGLKEAGYATNPKYPDLLIGLIERYQLNRFDVGEKAGEKMARENKVEAEIKSNNAVAPNTEAIKAPVKMVIYEVKSNDSLAGIAQRFKVSVEKLKQANGLSGETINLGQLLIITN